METREAIGSLRVLSESSIQHVKDVYTCFLDYEKAFNRVDWIKLMEALTITTLIIGKRVDTFSSYDLSCHIMS